MTPNDIPEWVKRAVGQILANLDDRRGIDFGAWDREIVREMKKQLARIIASHAPAEVSKEGAPPINERLLEACKDAEKLCCDGIASWSLITKVGLADLHEKCMVYIADADSYIPRYNKLVQIARLVVEAKRKMQLCNHAFAMGDIVKAWKLAAPILEDIEGPSAEAGTAKEEEKK